MKTRLKERTVLKMLNFQYALTIKGMALRCCGGYPPLIFKNAIEYYLQPQKMEKKKNV